MCGALHALALTRTPTAEEVALPKATVNKFVNDIAGGLGTCSRIVTASAGFALCLSSLAPAGAVCLSIFYPLIFFVHELTGSICGLGCSLGWLPDRYAVDVRDPGAARGGVYRYVLCRPCAAKLCCLALYRGCTQLPDEGCVSAGGPTASSRDAVLVQADSNPRFVRLPALALPSVTYSCISS